MKKTIKSNSGRVKSLSGVILRGFAKKENGHWVAVCIDLNIVAQGETDQIAVDKCFSLCKAYIDYVRSEHPDKMNRFIPRQAPQELIDEYNKITNSNLKKKSLRSKSPLINFSPLGLADCRA